MKKRASKKLFEYISDNVTINSEIELTDEQVTEVSCIAQEIRFSISYIHSNEIAKRIYIQLKRNISGVEVFCKNEKIWVKVKS